MQASLCQSCYDGEGHLIALPILNPPHPDTFNLINISPQNHSMNASIWAQLERWTLKVAKEHEDKDTFVVSGPLWLPARQAGEKLFEYQYNALGNPPSLVSVPTHFYKIVVAIDKKSSQIMRFACFVIPNTEFSKNEGSQKGCLQDYLVPWSSLEAVTGLHFFPALTNDPSWKERANRMTTELLTNNRSQPLMITDGNKATKGTWGYKKQPLLAHYCANGGCR